MEWGLFFTQCRLFLTWSFSDGNVLKTGCLTAIFMPEKICVHAQLLQLTYFHIQMAIEWNRIECIE